MTALPSLAMPEYSHLSDLELIAGLAAMARELEAREQIRTEFRTRTAPGRHTGLAEGIIAVLRAHQEGRTLTELRVELERNGISAAHLDGQILRFVKRGLIAVEGERRPRRYRLA